ncbi:MAG: transcriptional regulator [Cereibacter sphaeroides]|uniref:Transcriptional regulator n=1 Tax=Cereibacter sphaeroides TaxID=1063 RepID=A0A2W5USD8_CERSP|nr:MAG: transcriptional regulator [Cereibacter sphaeroides]
MSILDPNTPSSTETDDPVFRALASPFRRSLMDALRDGPLTTGSLCAAFPAQDRCTVMQHLGVLTDAGLVVAERRGRERWNHLNTLPIRRIQDRWIAPHAARAVDKLSDLDRRLGG